MVHLDFEIPNIPLLKDKGFVADMHFHTQYSHDCLTPVKVIIDKARKLGIWVAFTDHNQIGGVLEARKFKDAPVIPGIEICSKEGKEVIGYFYDDTQLEEFYNKYILPNLKDKNALRSTRTPYRMADILAWLEQYECVIHLPHPFAPQPRKSYPFFSRPTRSHLLENVDSIEVFNPNVVRRGNLSSLGWAVQLRKGAAGGSDGHRIKWLGSVVTCSKAKTMHQHLDNIKKGEARIYGVELRPHERAINYAATTVRNKIRRGVRGGIKKGLSLPRKALEHW